MASQKTEYTVSVKVIGDNNLKKLMSQMDSLNAKAGDWSKKSQGFKNANETISKSSAQLQNNVRNVSFQIQDLVVQMTNGTSASRAFGMQLPQLLSSFGTLGVVAGAAAAFLPVIATAFGNSALSAEDLAKETADLNSAFDSLGATLQSESLNLDELTKKWGENAAAIYESNQQLQKYEKLELKKKLEDDAEAIKATITSFSNFRNPLSDLIKDNTEFGSSAREVTTSLGLIVDAAEAIGGESSPIGKAGKNLQDIIDRLATTPKAELPEALKKAESALEKLVETIDSQGQSVPQFLINLGKSFESFNQSAEKSDAIARGLTQTFSGLKAVIGSIGSGLNDFGKQFDNQVQSLVDLKLAWDAQTDAQLRASLAMEKWYPLVEQGMISQEAFNAERARLVASYDKPIAAKIDKEAEALQRYQESMQRSADAIAASVNPLEAYLQRIEQLDEVLASGKLSYDDYAAAVAKADETLNNAFGDKAVDKVKTMQETIGDMAKSRLGGLVDVFFEADKSFSDFAANFLKSIAKMIAEQQVMKALSLSSFGSYFGFATGGAFNGMSLPEGVYTQPTYFGYGSAAKPFATGGLLGEAGPEAVLPLMRNSAGRLGVSSSPVNVVVNNNSSSEISINESEASDGSRTIEVLVEGQIKKAMSSGGLDKIMRANYGIRRRGE